MRCALTDNATVGRPTAQPAPQPAVGGWHPIEWACEFAGVFAILLAGTFAVVLGFASGSPVADQIHSTGWRLLIVGSVFPATGSLLSVTPLGKLSGAHFNPAVSFGFFLQRHLHWHDLAGFVTAQCMGAIAGAGLAAGLAPGLTAQVHHAITAPGHGLSGLEVAAIEAAMTAALVLVIFFMVSSPRTARLTPWVVWPVITILVWQGAPYTGTSLNPARTLGPDLIAHSWVAFWAYVAGPLMGSVIASMVWAGVRSRRTLTAKLFHDPFYPTTTRTELPAMPPIHASRNG